MLKIQSSSSVRESDVLPHIEDTDGLFWVYRNGEQLQRSWNELSSLEKQYQLEASRREQFNAMFAPNGGESY